MEDILKNAAKWVASAILRRLSRIPIMAQYIVLLVTVGAFIAFGCWCEETTQRIPLTLPPFPVFHEESPVPDYGARSHPGKFWPFANGSTPCRSCHRHTAQRGVRHFAWWSGDRTRTEWMQSVSQCKVCNTLNVVQQDIVKGNATGDHRSILPDLPQGEKWTSLDALRTIAHDATVEPLNYTPDNNPSPYHFVPHGTFISRRVVWQVGGADLLWEKETLRVAFDTNAHQGTLLVVRQYESVIPSWLCRTASWCYRSLSEWWFVIPLVLLVVVLPWAARRFGHQGVVHSE
jgi:hypothetical protein